MPAVTQRGCDSAGTRSLKPSLGLREKEVSRFKCLEESNNRRKHMASPGTIRGPQRGHAQVHAPARRVMDTHSPTEAPPPLAARACTHTCTWTWLLNGFCFQPLESRVILSSPWTESPPHPRSSGIVLAGWRTSVHLPSVPLSLVPLGPLKRFAASL